MRKTHIKLGLLIAMTCLFLTVGAVTGGDASAHNVQAAGRFRPWFANRPHISVRFLANKAHHASHSYKGLAVISGVGFNACDSCAPAPVPAPSDSSPCDSSCNSANNANSADTTCSGYTSCSTTTNTTTTTTTSVTSTSPSTTYTAPSPSTSNNTVPNTVPASTCPSYNTSTCGNSAPAPAATPAPSDTGCSCNTVNLQSSTPISASGVNLSAVPVNAYGEFQVTVNVQPIATQTTTTPTIWAVNSYNNQPSNSAPMCFCNG